MRLSSISSQDSGFTSQDTLFLRPGSPGRKVIIKTLNQDKVSYSLPCVTSQDTFYFIPKDTKKSSKGQFFNMVNSILNVIAI